MGEEATNGRPEAQQQPSQPSTQQNDVNNESDAVQRPRQNREQSSNYFSHRPPPDRQVSSAGRNAESQNVGHESHNSQSRPSAPQRPTQTRLDTAGSKAMDFARPVRSRQGTNNSLRTLRTQQSRGTNNGNFGGQRTMTQRTAKQGESPYSLAGPRQGPTRGGTYVAEGYRDLNPQFEKEVEKPTFSLGGNLPHTVRGYQRRKGKGGKKDAQKQGGGQYGVEGGEKGETEVPPAIENADQKATRTDSQRQRTDSQRQSNGSQDRKDRFDAREGSGGSGNVKMRQERLMDSDGRDLGPIGEEPVLNEEVMEETWDEEEPLEDEDYEEEPEDDGMPEDWSFNSWARFRRRFQDPIGEWLGTMVLCFVGISANLSITTSQQQAGSVQTMYWAWGFAVMLGIYISGGSSGGHLNPAITVILSVYRGFPGRRVPVYIVAQILGAFTGALLAFAIYRDDILHLDGALIPSSTGINMYTQPKAWITPATAFFTEVLATGLLCASILALGDDSNSPPGAGMHAFIIGLLVTTLLMALSWNTGGCMNPARDLGPRLAAMAVGYPTSIFNAGNAWWIWGAWGATITGALLGAALYDACIFKGGESPINYSPQKWAAEGHKAARSAQVEGRRGQMGWLKLLGRRRTADSIGGKLEKGEL